MSVSALLGNPKPQFFVGGLPADGYRLFFYAVGTSTKQNTVTDSTAVTTNSNPITLDAEGYPTGNVMIYGTDNIGYKVVMAPPGSDDPPTSPTWTIDKIYTTASGIVNAGTTVVNFTATAGQTLFSLPSGTSYGLGNNSLAVYLGSGAAGGRLRLTEGEDYSETSTSSFTLTYGAVAGDRLTVIIGQTLASPSTVAASSTILTSGDSLQDYIGYRSIHVDDAPYNAAGDGLTDDTAAINAALAVGGVIELTPGKTYLCASSLSSWVSDTIFLGNGATIKYSSIASGIVMTSISNVKVLNLEIDGNKSSYTPDDAFGIYTINCTNVEIAGCHIHDCWRAGIQFGHTSVGLSNKCYVHDNYIYNIGDATEATQYGNGVAVIHAYDVHIYDNDIYNIYGTAGINLEGVTYYDIFIHNNKIGLGTGSNLRGISMYETGATVHDNIVVTNNIVLDQLAAGITFTGDGDRIISGNIVRNSGEEGIKCVSCGSSQITITDNQVIGCGANGYPGIQVPLALNLNVSNNLVAECPSGSTVGMVLSNTGGNSATIIGNSVIDPQTNAYELSCDNFVFSGNKAHNIGAIGSGSNYFLKNRTSVTCNDGVVDNCVMTQGAGTATAFWLINGSNWVDIEFGKAQIPSTVTEFSFSSATGCRVTNVLVGNPPDLAGAIGTAAAWRVGDFLRKTPPAAGAVGWSCSVAGTPGTWVAV